MDSRLTPLQRRILSLLRGFTPAWTLTGGGALAGYILGHRVTRDLDLFFRGLVTLGELPREIESTLRADGLQVSTSRAAPGYRRLEVRDGAEIILVDLVAEPTPGIEDPIEIEPGLLVDSPHEILVNKLCALLGRTAIRDLVDVAALLGAGGDLDRALRDAPKKDSGFSPPTLAWVLSSLEVEKLARSSNLEPAPLLSVRDLLIERLLRPDPSSAPA